jgi:hypothetical protein
MIAAWPESLASSPLWVRTVRCSVRTNMSSVKDLNFRREQLLIPGRPLVPTDADSRIPILLVHRPGAPDFYGFDTAESFLAVLVVVVFAVAVFVCMFLFFSFIFIEIGS